MWTSSYLNAHLLIWLVPGDAKACGATSSGLALRHALRLCKGAQALAAAREAAGQLEAAGVPWQRPPDYFAEMVKSDAHMARVKAQLMHAQGEIAGAEER